MALDNKGNFDQNRGAGISSDDRVQLVYALSEVAEQGVTAATLQNGRVILYTSVIRGRNETGYKGAQDAEVLWSGKRAEIAKMEQEEVYLLFSPSTAKAMGAAVAMVQIDGQPERIAYTDYTTDKNWKQHHTDASLVWSGRERSFLNVIEAPAPARDEKPGVLERLRYAFLGEKSNLDSAVKTRTFGEVLTGMLAHVIPGMEDKTSMSYRAKSETPPATLAWWDKPAAMKEIKDYARAAKAEAQMPVMPWWEKKAALQEIKDYAKAAKAQEKPHQPWPQEQGTLRGLMKSFGQELKTVLWPFGGDKTSLAQSDFGLPLGNAGTLVEQRREKAVLAADSWARTMHKAFNPPAPPAKASLIEKVSLHGRFNTAAMPVRAPSTPPPLPPQPRARGIPPLPPHKYN